ncbi:MAG TPA: PIG-L family deacetylase [Gemmatimonadales bacterium]|nr:PIG-L family deacetylase [Gemmatimonadales bacterium]
MNPYQQYVSEIARLAREAKRLPLGGFAPLPRAKVRPDAPPVLIFAPHPDDECIVGGLALRLQREAGLRVVNVAVTQGSNKARQQPRWAELSAACEYLGFELVGTRPGGLEDINVEARRREPDDWRRSVEVISDILAQQKPAVVFLPHAADWNSTHIGTHHLVMDALAAQPAGFECTVVETEFWAAMTDPNLMAELAVEHVAHLLTALTFHVEEVRRNPYHVFFPAWLMDNVRRGSEIVGGQGAAAPDCTFATLYRLRRWTAGGLRQVFDAGRTLEASRSAGDLLVR